MKYTTPYALASSPRLSPAADPPAMLVLTFRDGRSTAMTYSYLYRVDFNGIDIIHLFFVDTVVIVRGRGLTGIVDRLHQHAEALLIEVDPLHASSTDGGCITSMEVRPGVQSRSL